MSSDPSAGAAAEPKLRTVGECLAAYVATRTDVFAALEPAAVAFVGLLQARDAFGREIRRLGEAFRADVAAAPEIRSYEKLLQEKCGYGETLARIMAHQIWRWGKSLAAEVRDGRKLRASMHGMAKAEGRSALVMSRRAKDLGETYRGLEAGYLLVEGAIEKAGLQLTGLEFGELVALARARDQAACCELARTCRRLAPHLPEQRGRPISDATCIHLFLERQLESWGHNCAYTSASDGAGFTDPVTRATQLASGNGASARYMRTGCARRPFCRRFPSWTAR
jgi:hypothetical protein